MADNHLRIPLPTLYPPNEPIRIGELTLRAMTPSELARWHEANGLHLFQSAERAVLGSLCALIDLEYTDEDRGVLKGSENSRVNTLVGLLNLFANKPMYAPFAEVLELGDGRLNRRVGSTHGTMGLLHPPVDMSQEPVPISDQLHSFHQELMLDEPKARQMRLALNHLLLAEGRIFADDKLLDAWIALECLFSGQQEVTDAIAMTMTIRIAQFLKNDRANRGETAMLVRKLYGVRSKLVHGNVKAGRDVLEAADESHKLLRLALRRILLDGSSTFNPESLVADFFSTSI